MKKRVLSMMLCLCMVLMMTPAAFAQDGVAPGIIRALPDRHLAARMCWKKERSIC